MASSDPRDLYSSIVMRTSLLSGGCDSSRESTNAKILAAAGESDNNLGGLFGTENFFGETALPPSGQTKSTIAEAKDALFLDTSGGAYLTTIGRNVGVVRPPPSPFDDELFRKIIPVLAWLPKTILHTSIRLAEAVFGTQAALELAGQRAWQFYEVNPNEIIFECPQDLITGSQANASYLHGVSGNLSAITGPTGVITYVGSDANVAASGGVALRTIYIYHTGAWTPYTISSSTYNTITKVNTLVVSPATVPTGAGNPFFVDIPSTTSFAGDYMLSDATVAADGTNPPVASLVYLFGRGVLDIFTFYEQEYLRASGVVLRIELI